MERTYPSERLMESRIGQLEDYFPQKVFILFFHADVFSSFDSISPCFNQICRHPAGYRPQPAGRYSAPLERLTAAIPWERFRLLLEPVHEKARKSNAGRSRSTWC